MSILRNVTAEDDRLRTPKVYHDTQSGAAWRPQASVEPQNEPVPNSLSAQPCTGHLESVRRFETVRARPHPNRFFALSDDFFLPREHYIRAPHLDEIEFSDARVMIGHQGPVVLQMQEALNALGCRVTLDGKFGFETYLAIRHFQRNHHLVETGRVDKKALKVLINSLK